MKAERCASLPLRFRGNFWFPVSAVAVAAPEGFAASPSDAMGTPQEQICHLHAGYKLSLNSAERGTKLTPNSGKQGIDLPRALSQPSAS